jgi:deazaflavin-dependent oxidoreductase (nitroreductase family)
MSTTGDSLYGREHVERYEATDGEEGHIWRNGTTTLILTTRGRRSGERRRTPLIYRPYGDQVLVVASDGGAHEPPSWYLNMLEEPTVGVQILGDRYTARGRDATDEERPEMWKVMAAAWPDYDEYQTRTDRQIQIVVLERV